MAILNFDGENFVRFSFGSVMMGFPILGLMPVGIVALMQTFSAMKRFNSWGAVGRLLLGYLGLAGAQVVVALFLISFDSSKPQDSSIGSLLFSWFVLYIIGMFVFYRNDRIYYETAKSETQSK